MQKQVVITFLSGDGQLPKAIAGRLHTYGFDAVGGPWKDDLVQMEWQGQQELLLKPETAAWIIVATPEEMESATLRYGLSALALAVTAAKPFIPCFLLSTGAAAFAAENLPTPLAGMINLAAADQSLSAKLVAKVNLPHPKSKGTYRLSILGTPQIGQWFEVGPAAGVTPWKGAIFGVTGGEIDFQAVGPSGELPKNSTLSYPSNGIKLTMQGKEFTAWGVANELAPGESYYARVRGNPEMLLFGPFPDSDDPELYYQRMS